MLFLAFRHLLSRKRQTILTLLGILLGTTAYVVISGFMLGFQGFLLDQLVNNDAHVHVTSREEILRPHTLDREFFGDKVAHIFWDAPPGGREDYARIDNPASWEQRLNADPRVTAYSEQLTAQAVIAAAKVSASASLIGCQPERQVRVTNINDFMVQGRFLDIGSGGNRLIAGSGLLDKLGATVNDTVFVTVGRAAPVPFKIVGSFTTGIKMIDDVRAFGALSDIQKINGTLSQINEIAVKLKDYSVAALVADDWAATSNEKVQSWDQINANFLSVFKIQDTTRYLMIGIILVVAGFGIYNILNMVVNQKKKEIAILRSMGFEPWDVGVLFLSQGLILGVVGGLIGLVLGYFICLYLQTLKFGGGPMGGSGHIKIAWDVSIYIKAMTLGLTAATIASLLPARAAGRMTPIDIIRFGGE